MKVCFKCDIEKDLGSFYKHKGMKDGHLNKCIDCAKKDSDNREKELRKNPEWYETEKARHRDKYFRLGYKEKHKPTPEMKAMTMARYKNKYPEKVKAKIKSQRMKATVKGNQLHHWSYNEEHYKDVIELSVADHNKIHRYIVYDQERMMYRRTDNNKLLDTREASENYYKMVLDLFD